MKEYTVMIGGLEHTVMLSDEDAKTQDAKAAEAKKSRAPANKARTASNK